MAYLEDERRLMSDSKSTSASNRSVDNLGNPSDTHSDTRLGGSEIYRCRSTPVELLSETDNDRK